MALRRPKDRLAGPSAYSKSYLNTFAASSNRLVTPHRGRLCKNSLP
jgi:hypothetical protein